MKYKNFRALQKRLNTKVEIFIWGDKFDADYHHRRIDWIEWGKDYFIVHYVYYGDDEEICIKRSKNPQLYDRVMSLFKKF